ncbi:MAG: hypothetical protein TR69_WS6001000881 [candidate division WS6 bacterium OLB20]|uniref:Uncharacterized protein n=1 Tax=candidate division WS6 bacterium OLB20 TaxID=1617426 RepID=A0A136LYX0_9BACT|nr:MAG: hypothetical protein TR69_WS6001000881 [candidate division WS6 bacterium OLB20]
MQKFLLPALALIVVLVACAVILLAFLSAQGQNQRSELREQNPAFHTVEVGGTCRPDIGDCKEGFTCADGICAKP